MSETPESIEALIEGVRRDAGVQSDLWVDLQLAASQAKRDVCAAHGAHTSAEAWQRLTLALDEVRRMRVEARREIADLTGPPSPVVRRLSAEELADEVPPDSSC